MMDKKDAIDYLLYMKHDVQAGSPVDVAIDTAIEALKETEKQPKTNGDCIRNMTDDEELLIAIGIGCYRCAYINGECDRGYGKRCIDGNLEWLKQEVSEDAAERTY
jgi:hypothetical protein